MNKVKVGPFMFSFKYVPRTGSDCDGLLNLATQKIYISKLNQNGETFKTESLHEICLHEIVHAIDYVYNNLALEEDVVQRLTIGVFAFLKDNKKLILEFLEEIEDDT